MNDIAPRLEECLRTHLRRVPRGQRWDRDTSLEELGLDSVSAINLLLDLETTFVVTFPDEMINPQTFRSAATLQQAIESLLQRPQLHRDP